MFNSAPIKQAMKVKPFKNKQNNNLTRLKTSSFRENINPSIPTKPQYHPMGSTTIPGADLKVAANQLPSIKQTQLPTLSKTAGVITTSMTPALRDKLLGKNRKKDIDTEAIKSVTGSNLTESFNEALKDTSENAPKSVPKSPLRKASKGIFRSMIKDTTHPLNLGLSTLNVASGEASVGGEVAGQASLWTAKAAIRPLVNKIYTEGITKNTRLRRWGSGALSALTGVAGYIAGNYVGNKYAPLYKRNDPNMYDPSDAEINAINRVYNRGINRGNVKTASLPFVTESLKLAKQGVGGLLGSINKDSIRSRVGNLTAQALKKVPIRLPKALVSNKKIVRLNNNVKKAIPYAATGAAVIAGNAIYREKQNKAKEAFYNSLAKGS